jgi:hypothetical protein
VLDHLPERDRPAVKTRLRRAWRSDDHAAALEQLRRLAGELERSHPGAAASLNEGLEETLTVTRLGVRGPLKRTLQSTNPIESMIECVRRTSRNVKRWQHGEMCLRWTAAGMPPSPTPIPTHRRLHRLHQTRQRRRTRPHHLPPARTGRGTVGYAHDRLNLSLGPPPTTTTTGHPLGAAR